MTEQRGCVAEVAEGKVSFLANFNDRRERRQSRWVSDSEDVERRGQLKAGLDAGCRSTLLKALAKGKNLLEGLEKTVRLR